MPVELYRPPALSRKRLVNPWQEPRIVTPVTTSRRPTTRQSPHKMNKYGPEDRDSQRDIGENDVFVARVEEIFHQKLEILNRQEEGSFSGRRAIRHKGRRVDSAALEEVNRLIGTLWDTGPRESKNFWVLNCVVAGARTMQELSANARSAISTHRKKQRDMKDAIDQREA